jgi:hypothetical protein
MLAILLILASIRMVYRLRLKLHCLVSPPNLNHSKSFVIFTTTNGPQISMIAPRSCDDLRRILTDAGMRPQTWCNGSGAIDVKMGFKFRRKAEVATKQRNFIPWCPNMVNKDIQAPVKRSLGFGGRHCLAEKRRTLLFAPCCPSSILTSPELQADTVSFRSPTLYLFIHLTAGKEISRCTLAYPV